MQAQSRIFEEAFLAEFNPNKTKDMVDWFGDDLSDEARQALRLRGRVLGSEGTTRTAYAHKTDPSLCIKVAATGTYGRGQTFFNKAEADAWKAVAEHPELAKWFAPVRWISECGFVLFQDRAEARKGGVPRSKFPKQMPGIFGLIPDMHTENFGFINGQIVAIDYPVPMLRAALKQKSAHEMLDVWWSTSSPVHPRFGNKPAKQR